MRQLKEQLAVEKQAWEENYMKKQETYLMQKERELKEQVRKDRDKEIEMVIGRLEEDTQATRDECERVAENRIKYDLFACQTRKSLLMRGHWTRHPLLNFMGFCGNIGRVYVWTYQTRKVYSCVVIDK